MEKYIIGVDTIECDQLLQDGTIRKAGIYELYNDGEYKKTPDNFNEVTY